MSNLKKQFSKLFNWFRPNQKYINLNKNLSGLDSAWHLVLLYLLYSSVTVIMYGLLQVPHYIGYLIWTAIGIGTYYIVMTKYVYAFEKPEKIINTKLSIFLNKLKNLLKLSLLSFCIILIYIFISNIIPHAQLALTFGNSSSIRIIIPVIVLTVLVQPLFEGIMIRGIITDQVNRFKINNWIKFMIPVIVSVIIHVLAATTMIVFVHYLLISLSIQYVRNRFGLITSIHLHMILSLLMFSFFQM